MLEGAGNIIEVDEGGAGTDRGQKRDNHYAVSYTSDAEHRISRNNGCSFRPDLPWRDARAARRLSRHALVEV